MSQYEIRSFSASDVEQVIALQQKYARAYPPCLVISGEVYLSPGFHDGQDIFFV